MTNRRYAAETTVSVDRSKNEIETLLERHGADSFMYGWDDQKVIVGFRYNGFMVRIAVPLPDRESDEIRLTPSGKQRRNDQSAEKVFQQAVRQRWRAMMLIIKAKLEASESGITTFEEEFLAHIVLPDNRTVAQFLLPQIEQAYLVGDMPKMLPGR